MCKFHRDDHKPTRAGILKKHTPKSSPHRSYENPTDQDIQETGPNPTPPLSPHSIAQSGHKAGGTYSEWGLLGPADVSVSYTTFVSNSIASSIVDQSRELSPGTTGLPK